ncbi:MULTISPECIES: helix-turn-helix domain-containing protein [Pseudonocardia]|uniref:Anaerobic benzoate catabolism transcriptional regulator n=2 Tax=Pseudonocardia TaxID=1847 RepID=A0A1Y2MPZ7_PSEAH|nr:MULTISPECIES: helix-turn-helix transcriptional regulator [Pseudonocardia]OSY37295.1 anaerobic benzoate catabolism transcriptional regulator [Pseudonocardia autotrophica]TDN72408.1 transcriptional regulator with XRE-family HTH domain [Pseudonocardia autotrophica]BBG03117.1 transcriptional regulator [Pseudonocardia autotrophica]GEC23736.1 transcriptional regulator [Pseudonocardia saturnea]
MGDGPDLIGRRLREVRAWRGLSLRATAELAGLSASYLSRIERGERPVERRSTVEALAGALRVAPTELTGRPVAPHTPGESEGHAAVEDLRGALRDIELDAVTPESTGGLRTLPELRHDVDRAAAASFACDYRCLGAVLPDLLPRVWAHAGRIDGARTLLIECLFHAFYLAKDLGYRDVGWSIAGHLHRAAEATDDPAWVAIADYMRAEAMVGAHARTRALEAVVRSADALTPDAGPAGQAYGMLRLSAALQSAATGAVDVVPDYLAEAADISRHTGDGNFGGQHFGPRNVAVWRVAMAVEVGEIDRVPELAEAVDVEALPLGRRAWFLMDVGRGLAAQRGRETVAVDTLRQAEELAPQLVHANPFVRETVADLLRRARRDAGGRELRGIAYRMGMGA